MSLILPLIGMGASAIGAGIQAGKEAKAEKLAEQNYNKQRQLMLSDIYANPLDSVANKALLSQMDRRLAKQEEAVANQAAAGGATFENVLAAKQAGNEAMADVISGVMQGETARQDALRQQLLNVDSQRTAQQIAAKQQSGARWAGLTDNFSGALNTFGGTLLETDTSLRNAFKF